MIYEAHQKDKAKREIDRLFEMGKKYVQVKDYFPPKTIGQHGLYWLWVTCIAVETGNKKMVIHQFIKDNFIESKMETITLKGQSFTILLPPTTKGKDTKATKELLDKVQLWATELGIKLPDPNDRNFEKFREMYDDGTLK